MTFFQKMGLQPISGVYSLKVPIDKNKESIKGTDPFFLTNSGHNYHFLFMGEKVSTSIWKRVPKYKGATSTRTPSKWGLIYIYIIVCITL